MGIPLLDPWANRLNGFAWSPPALGPRDRRSGIAKGQIISLTLASAELVAMLVLLWTGPGATVAEAEPTDDSPSSGAFLSRRSSI